MKLWTLLCLLLLPLAYGQRLAITLDTPNQVESRASNPTALLAAFPTCAQPCLVQAIANSTCDFTNLTCICSTTSLEDQAQACVTRSCTIKDQLHAKNATQTTCGRPIRNRSAEYETMDIAGGLITMVIVFLRLYFRVRVQPSPWGPDDYFLYIAFISAIPSTVINFEGLTANGLGQDIWTLPFDMITRFIRFFYIMQIMYFTHIPLLKTAMLFFYLRIFPDKTVRRLLWGTVAVNALGGISFIVVTIFQCSPISFYWDRWDNAHQGSCLNINGIGWASSVFSIALDIWMLAVPLSQLNKLRLHWKKKLGVIMMFVVGTFVTVVSILRLQSLITFANSDNPTWDQYGIAKWSTIEIHVGIMCACMPALRGLLARLFPYVFGSGLSSSAAKLSNYAKIGGAFQPKANKSGKGETGSRGGGVEFRDDGSWPLTPADSKTQGITYSKSFIVDYETDLDETKLVNLQPMKPAQLKSSCSAGTFRG